MGHKQKKKSRRKSNAALIVLLCLCACVSLLMIVLGTAELNAVNEEIAQNAEIARFSLRAEGSANAVPSPALAEEAVVTRTSRVERAQDAHAQDANTPQACALLTLHLEKETTIAVYDGTSDRVLSMGAGRSEGMAAPNTLGRCVLHGHRDSAFAPLAHILLGDELTLETTDGALRYAVTDVYVTDPTDTKIYEQSDHMQLALVTCYPFSFVGPAPERYVVIADAMEG